MDENMKALTITLIRCTRALVQTAQCLTNQQNPPYFEHPHRTLNEAAELVGDTTEPAEVRDEGTGPADG